MKGLKTDPMQSAYVGADTNVQEHERYSASLEDKGGQAAYRCKDYRLLNDRMTDLIETAKADYSLGWIFWLWGEIR